MGIQSAFAMDNREIVLPGTKTQEFIQNQDQVATLVDLIKTSLPQKPTHAEIEAFHKIEAIAKERKLELSKLTNHYTAYEAVYQKYLKTIKGELKQLKEKLDQARKAQAKTDTLEDELHVKDVQHKVNLIKYRYYVIPASDQAKALNNKDLEYYANLLKQKDNELTLKQRLVQEAVKSLEEKNQVAQGIRLQLTELRNVLAAKPTDSAMSEEAQKIVTLTTTLKPVEQEIKKQEHIKSQAEADIELITKSMSDSRKKIDDIKVFIEGYEKRKEVSIKMLEEEHQQIVKAKQAIEAQLKSEQSKLASTTLENKPSIESTIKDLEVQLADITVQFNEAERCMRKKDKNYGFIEAASYEAKRTLSNLGSSLVSFLKGSKSHIADEKKEQK
jgi:DNA repair exonuclease SbcCD ATPase subunit